MRIERQDSLEKQGIEQQLEGQAKSHGNVLLDVNGLYSEVKRRRGNQVWLEQNGEDKKAIDT